MTLFPSAHRLAIDSGKGGVGKSTVAAALGYALAARGHRTLIIDIDFHGPSLGTLLNLPPLTVDGDEENPRIIPSSVAPNLYAISVAQLVPAGAPVTWRSGSVEGFMMFLGARLELMDAEYILFDMPPGTGDAESTTFKYAKPNGVIMVTTGSMLSFADTDRAAVFARNHRVPVLGVAENMSWRDVEVGGETVRVRLFGEEEDTIEFTESLVHDNGFGEKRSPQYLGSLPFVSDPQALAQTAEFEKLADVAEAAEDLWQATENTASRKVTVSMSLS